MPGRSRKKRTRAARSFHPAAIALSMAATAAAATAEAAANDFYGYEGQQIAYYRIMLHWPQPTQRLRWSLIFTSCQCVCERLLPFSDFDCRQCRRLHEHFSPHAGCLPLQLCVCVRVWVGVRNALNSGWSPLENHWSTFCRLQPVHILAPAGCAAAKTQFKFPELVLSFKHKEPQEELQFYVSLLD